MGGLVAGLECEGRALCYDGYCCSVEDQGLSWLSTARGMSVTCQRPGADSQQRLEREREPQSPIQSELLREWKPGARESGERGSCKTYGASFHAMLVRAGIGMTLDLNMVSRYAAAGSRLTSRGSRRRLAPDSTIHALSTGHRVARSAIRSVGIGLVVARA
eukprot:3046573-Rhodomonas_salina.4